MKTANIFLISLLLLYFSNIGNNKVVADNRTTTQDTIRILSSSDLYLLTTQWVRAYCKQNPQKNIIVTQTSEALTTRAAHSGANLCFISSESTELLNNESFWKMEVGHEAIVPIMNSKNPFLAEINKQGISPEKFAELLKNPDARNWNFLLQNGQDIPVHFYVINHESMSLNISNFIGTKQFSFDGVAVKNAEDLISAIQKDQYAIGFCELKNIVSNQDFVENIRILPIDKNSNGRIDNFENIYANLESFTRGAWIGKYPRALCQSIYTFAPSQPTNESEIAFLQWVLTDGQQHLAANGYYDLVSSDKRAKLDLLSHTQVAANTAGAFYPILIVALLIVAIVGLFFLIITLLSKTQKKLNFWKQQANCPPFSMKIQ